MVLLLVPGPLRAMGELILGDEVVQYTESLVTEGVRLYFVDGVVVTSAHDTTADGTANVWLLYGDGYVRGEAHDTDGDSVADTFLRMDADGRVTDFSGVAADMFRDGERAPLSGEELADTDENERAVANWVSAKTEAERSEAPPGSWGLLLVLGTLVVGGLVFAITRRR
jgi:hypothetical protein